MTNTRKYKKPDLITAAVCPWSGRPRYLSAEQNRQNMQTELDATKGTDRRISFCTNPMRDRGTVYSCTIDDSGIAHAHTKQCWWAMSYTEPRPVQKILGDVCVVQVSGSYQYTWQVGSLRLGQG